MNKSLAICLVLICFVARAQKTVNDSLADFDYVHFNKHLSQIKDKTEKENYLNSIQRNYIKRRYNLIDKKTVSSEMNAISCTNSDFEFGNTATWAISGDFQIMSGSGIDPFGGFPIVCPGGNYSLRLNDNNTACSGPTPKANFGASATKTISLTSLNSIIKVNFAACILEFPHPQNAASFFKIEFFDQFNASIPTPSFSACYASPPNAVVSTYPVTSTLTTMQGAQICSTVASYPVRYYPWQTQQFNLSSYIGQNVSIKLTANWCLFNYDWGYAYFDVCCDSTCSNILANVKNLEKDNSILYPNPFKNEIIINIKTVRESAEFILFNCLGLEIFRRQLSDGKNSIETEGIPKGLYIYSIEHQNKPIKQGKLVKD